MIHAESRHEVKQGYSELAQTREATKNLMIPSLVCERDQARSLAQIKNALVLQCFCSICFWLQAAQINQVVDVLEASAEVGRAAKGFSHQTEGQFGQFGSSPPLGRQPDPSKTWGCK